MRKVKVDMSELALAFETDFPEASSLLNVETGEVLMVTDEVREAIDEFFEETDIKEGEDPKAKFEEWLKEYHCPEWQRDSIREAYLVETDSGERFIQMPTQESRDGYRDMAEFAEAVGDRHLQELLSVALNGKGAFRRFKDVLADYPDTRKQWFEFSEQKVKERILEWLESEEIEVEQ